MAILPIRFDSATLSSQLLGKMAKRGIAKVLRTISRCNADQPAIKASRNAKLKRMDAELTLEHAAIKDVLSRKR